MLNFQNITTVFFLFLFPFQDQNFFHGFTIFRLNTNSVYVIYLLICIRIFTGYLLNPNKSTFKNICIEKVKLKIKAFNKAKHFIVYENLKNYYFHFFR